MARSPCRYAIVSIAASQETCSCNVPVTNAFSSFYWKMWHKMRQWQGTLGRRGLWEASWALWKYHYGSCCVCWGFRLRLVCVAWAQGTFERVRHWSNRLWTLEFFEPRQKRFLNSTLHVLLNALKKTWWRMKKCNKQKIGKRNSKKMRLQNNHKGDLIDAPDTPRSSCF